LDIIWTIPESIYRSDPDSICAWWQTRDARRLSTWLSVASCPACPTYPFFFALDILRCPRGVGLPTCAFDFSRRDTFVLLTHLMSVIFLSFVTFTRIETPILHYRVGKTLSHKKIFLKHVFFLSLPILSCSSTMTAFNRKKQFCKIFWLQLDLDSVRKDKTSLKKLFLQL